MMRPRMTTPMPVKVAANAMGLSAMTSDYSYSLIEIQCRLRWGCAQVAYNRDRVAVVAARVVSVSRMPTILGPDSPSSTQCAVTVVRCR